MIYYSFQRSINLCSSILFIITIRRLVIFFLRCKTVRVISSKLFLTVIASNGSSLQIYVPHMINIFYLFTANSIKSCKFTSEGETCCFHFIFLRGRIMLCGYHYSGRRALKILPTLQNHAAGQALFHNLLLFKTSVGLSCLLDIPAHH